MPFQHQCRMHLAGESWVRTSWMLLDRSNFNVCANVGDFSTPSQHKCNIHFEGKMHVKCNAYWKIHNIFWSESCPHRIFGDFPTPSQHQCHIHFYMRTSLRCLMNVGKTKNSTTRRHVTCIKVLNVVIPLSVTYIRVWEGKECKTRRWEVENTKSTKCKKVHEIGLTYSRSW